MTALSEHRVHNSPFLQVAVGCPFPTFSVCGPVALGMARFLPSTLFKNLYLQLLTVDC